MIMKTYLMSRLQHYNNRSPFEVVNTCQPHRVHIVALQVKYLLCAKATTRECVGRVAERENYQFYSSWCDTADVCQHIISSNIQDFETVNPQEWCWLVDAWRSTNRCISITGWFVLLHKIQFSNDINSEVRPMISQRVIKLNKLLDLQKGWWFNGPSLPHKSGV